MGNERRRVVVLGGYGHFGAIVAERLSRAGGMEVIVAGRDGSKATALAGRIGARAACLDATSASLERDLGALAPWLLVSAAGPFQGQGYEVARACVRAGAHYIDLADGRDYVCGIAALDAEARAADVLVVSGASSVPALSSAVLDRYIGEFGELREIDFGISSSSRLPGIATTRAVLGYCGRRIPRWHEGEETEAIGLQGLRRHTFRTRPLRRWLLDCDVPDLELFPHRYPSLRSLRFGAGTELAPVQWGLYLIAHLVRRGWIADAGRAVHVLRACARSVAPLGTGRSAMFVEMRGVGRDGRPLERTWELHAAAEHGAQVPCLAAVALARKLALGLGARGAMPCVGLLTLDDYVRELAGLHVAVVGPAGPADGATKRFSL